LEQLHIVPTRNELTDANRIRTMKDRIPDLVTKFFGTETPWVIRNAGRDFEPWTCLCQFESDPMVSQGFGLEYSLLVVCWFTQEISVPLRQLLCEGLSELDWEAHAKDFHSEW
jgi:hypothetical protein